MTQAEAAIRHIKPNMHTDTTTTTETLMSGGDFTFIDLFAGIGGLRRAMEQVGNSVAVPVFDEVARAMHPHILELI